MSRKDDLDKIAIIGAAGFAREVRDICWDIGARNICFLGLEHDRNEIDGFPVYPDKPDVISDLVAKGWQLSIGVANPRARRTIARAHSQWPFAALLHPTASFGFGQRERVASVNGAIVAAGARFMSSISLGEHVVVSLNATIGHDVIIGSYCAVMPGASISGNVTLEAAVYVGAGAVTVNGEPGGPLVIGAGAIIGAGAVVVKDVPAAATIVGVPGKPLPQQRE